jgi:preprotein translocase subunit SecA
MVPYDVQIVGWIVIHQGKMAEMRTGEGKTLVATMPCYLNALCNKWVHVVTVNDYLASRDAQWMWYLYERLGLSVGSVVKSTPVHERREQYEKDITYVENSELGFDYLRDNLAKSMEDRNMLYRPMHYAIVDEVDSILIDEARTPLIISQASGEPTEKYLYYAQIVKGLLPSKGKKKISKWFLAELMKDDSWEEEQIDDAGDYYVDEKTKSVTLSGAGIEKLEKMLDVENLYKELWFGEIHHIENALKAQAVYNKDKEYLVREGQVMIVDDHTGRVMPWRRFSQWLHQAIEAKEQVEVKRESRTLASITYQHFFKQYEKLSWMTGTALTEAEEFESIYESETVTIPTNKPILRVDKTDAVYFNQDAKRKAVTDHIQFYHGVWVPILIGTSSIHTSELVSQILRKANLVHSVLNAKFHEQEAHIVRNSGKKGSIVVATNMAGRGTDIKLDKTLNGIIAQWYASYIKKVIGKGNTFEATIYSELEYGLVQDALKSHDIAFDSQINKGKKTAEDRYGKMTIWPVADAASVADPSIESRDVHFGLFILGTEKHDSRRIDNQLRGRAGRQGDPWVSQFFVALDDEIMRKMGGDKIQSIARMMMSQEELESMAFTQSQFTNAIERAQKQMEGWHFGIRKQLFEYDSVINKQRAKMYEKRDAILSKEADVIAFEHQEEQVDWSAQDVVSEERASVVSEIRGFVDETIDDLVMTHTSYAPWNIAELEESLQQIIGASFLDSELVQYTTTNQLSSFLKSAVRDMFDAKFAESDDPQTLWYIRRVYLSVIDKYWMEHIDDMSHLRERVSLRSYAQQDPLVIYKKEAYSAFQAFLNTVRKETLSNVMKTDFAALQDPQQVATHIHAQDQQKNVHMMEILKQLAGKQPFVHQSTVDWNGQKETHVVTLDTWETARVLNSNDDIEVLELDDTWTWDVGLHVVIPSRSKLRPNDKVNIQTPDGKREYGVKRKKVKDKVESGEVKLV